MKLLYFVFIIIIIYIISKLSFEHFNLQFQEKVFDPFLISFIFIISHWLVTATHAKCNIRQGEQDETQKINVKWSFNSLKDWSVATSVSVKV